MTVAKSPRPSVRDEHRELTRRRIEQAAVAAFESVGYAAASIDQICKSAGTSRATFYVHFSGKLELVSGLWGELRKPLLTQYRQLAALTCIDETALQRWLDGTFDFYSENRRALLGVHEAIAMEPEMAERYRERMTEVIDIIGPLIERSRGAESKAGVRAALLIMQHERFCHFWLLRAMPFDRATAGEVLAQMWAEQLAHPAAVAELVDLSNPSGGQDVRGESTTETSKR